ncbi:MAG: hypothetical protein PHQ40_16525 [Anaerolineaceae bacterium]|nr:hypothetical protein [Anaerolineaceae bacterium]
MEIKSETSSSQDLSTPPFSDSSSAQEGKPLPVPDQRKKTVAGFAKAWIIFWIVGNLAATCAPMNNLTNSRLAGIVVMVMLLSAATVVGYFLLYYKNHIGLYVILAANTFGIFLNNINVPGYSISVTTGLIIGIITYFVTRKQIAYPFGKSHVTN